MQKLKMHSPDLSQGNIARIRELFPNCVTEAHDANGQVVLRMDFDLLRQELSGELVEGPQERYRLDWPGKRQAMLTANAPIAKSLRPCREESVNFDTTENLYIEGDNLEVLKLLQESYLGKVKMIYIDPPYNTGNDYIYKDYFAENTGKFLQRDGQYDGDGKRMVQNLESNGRFHSDWLCMMYQRLRVARNLLTDDGAIFISIDDNEVAQLRKICDEIFGVSNFVTEFAWEKKKKPSFLHKNVGKLNDYIVCYAKNHMISQAFSIETTTEGKKYPFNNAGNGISKLTFPKMYVNFKMPDGVIKPQDMSEGAIITRLLDAVHIVNGRNTDSFRLEGEWRYSQEKLNEIVNRSEEIIISKVPFRPNHVKPGGEIKKMKNVLSPTHYQMETNEDATEQIVSLFGSDVFDNPKPIKLLNYLIKAISYNTLNCLILDFFSGSATTAHAVMQLNAEDGGKRKFIMVQLPEVCPPDSEAAKAGYKNICEIGKERIRRAGKKIKEEKPLATSDLDIGFRVLKVKPSCMADVYYTPDETEQRELGFFENITADATPEDLLFQVLTDWGVELHLPIAPKTIQGKTVFFVDENSLAACFDSGLNEDFIKALAAHKPVRAVFRDSGFADDAARINAEQIFKQLSPDTEVRVL